MCCHHLRMVLLKPCIECQCENSVLHEVFLFRSLYPEFFPFSIYLISAHTYEVQLDLSLGLVLMLDFSEHTVDQVQFNKVLPCDLDLLRLLQLIVMNGPFCLGYLLVNCDVILVIHIRSLFLFELLLHLCHNLLFNFGFQKAHFYLFQHFDDFVVVSSGVVLLDDAVRNILKTEVILVHH